MTDETNEDMLSDEQLAAANADWNKTLRRLGLHEADITTVRANDIAYLAKRWQFLQLVDLGGDQKSLEKPELITAKSGWTIINYGDAMATSPGKYLFGGGYFRIHSSDDDEGGGGIVNPHKGTLVKQAFDSVAEMIQLVKTLGWVGAQIIDGHPDMQRAAWVEACRIGVRLEGYTPDMKAEEMRRRAVSESIDEMRSAVNALKSRR